jgi:hypothetical protein
MQTQLMLMIETTDNGQLVLPHEHTPTQDMAEMASQDEMTHTHTHAHTFDTRLSHPALIDSPHIIQCPGTGATCLMRDSLSAELEMQLVSSIELN